MFEFLSTFHSYPGATLVHQLQGVIAGWMLVHAHYKGGVALRTYAFALLLMFVGYEALEQAGIQDKGWLDVLNCAVLMHISAAVTWVYHAVRKRRRTHKNQ